MNPFLNQETAENQQERPLLLQFNSAMHVHDDRPSLADFGLMNNVTEIYTMVWIHIMLVSGTFETLIVETSII